MFKLFFWKCTVEILSKLLLDLQQSSGIDQEVHGSVASIGHNTVQGILRYKYCDNLIAYSSDRANRRDAARASSTKAECGKTAT